MLVYGDPFYTQTMRQMQWHLHESLSSLQRNLQREMDLLDPLRRLLCQAGQWEQAIEDASPRDRTHPKWTHCLRQVRAITDNLAGAFYDSWSRRPSPIHTALADVAHALRLVHVEDSLPLRVKVPEGFAFYALYPEQYCAAAHAWLAEHQHASPKRAIVVGIRSIGTTLSAVVAAALRAHGWNIRRLTLRPTGHPYARHATINTRDLRDITYALVVDEGPGISGSSMAAAARALHDSGIDRPRISLFPSHDGAPGHQASDEVRACWATLRRYVTTIQTMRWHGRSLAELLATRTGDLCGNSDPVERTEELGGGLWRKVSYATTPHWPAVCATFERMKYRCVLRSGRAVLWKFAGFVGEIHKTDIHAMAAELQSRAQRGWTPPCLGLAHGFLAMPWIEGRPLHRADANPAALTHIGRYIVAAAAPPLSPSEQTNALARLKTMLLCNAREALCDAAAASAARCCDLACELQPSIPPQSYGDGHLAPHEWIRTSAGHLIKTDPLGHSTDHTMVGRQSLLWDVAGVWIEWDLDDHAAAPLLDAMPELQPLPAPLLNFYRLAYAAFRLGMCTLAQQMCSGDPDEQARLRHATDFYRAALARCLEMPSTSPSPR